MKIAKVLLLLAGLLPGISLAIGPIQHSAFTAPSATTVFTVTQSLSTVPTTGDPVVVNVGMNNNFVTGNVVAVWDNQGTTAVTGVTITGTAGQFATSGTAPAVGSMLTISGTYGGTGSITGYANPTNYVVLASGSGTFTLGVITTGVAVGTTGGTPTGLTYTAHNDVYTKIRSQIDGEGGVNNRAEVWWVSAVTYVTGTFTVSVGVTASQSTTIQVVEIPPSTVDEQGSTGTTTFPLTATASAANTSAGDFELGFISIAYGATAPTDPPTGWVSQGLVPATDGYIEGESCSRVPGTVETTSATWTWTTREDGAGIVVSFTPAAAPVLGPLGFGGRFIN